uniref:Uncharacterized protein n=1 Tax=Magallana gigas TaxID=29159 RepID=K1PY72_MAGGI
MQKSKPFIDLKFTKHIFHASVQDEIDQDVKTRKSIEHCYKIGKWRQGKQTVDNLKQPRCSCQEKQFEVDEENISTLGISRIVGASWIFVKCEANIFPKTR